MDRPIGKLSTSQPLRRKAGGNPPSTRSGASSWFRKGYAGPFDNANSQSRSSRPTDASRRCWQPGSLTRLRSWFRRIADRRGRDCPQRGPGIQPRAEGTWRPMPWVAPPDPCPERAPEPSHLPLPWLTHRTSGAPSGPMNLSPHHPGHRSPNSLNPVL